MTEKWGKGFKDIEEIIWKHGETGQEKKQIQEEISE